MLTRIAVGFWPVTITMAILPWSIPSLTDPEIPRRRVLLWSCAFALAGFVGGLVGGAYLVVGLLRRSDARPVRTRVADLLLWALGQSIWIIPSLVVMLTSTERRIADSTPFATTIDGIGGLGRLLAGMGFWNEGFQLGLTQPLLASVVGFLLLALAITGTRALPRTWRTPLVLVAALSFLVTIASAVPGIDTVFAHLTSTPAAASLRESQRFLFPFLLWIAISAPLGAAIIARRLPIALGGALIAVPLIAAVVMITPSAWGLEQQLVPAEIPSEWHEARAAIDASPGPVLALPWFQYYTSDVADGRLSLSPLPNFLGGDVISASDPHISDIALQENADGREAIGASIARDAADGVAVDDRLQDIGVRWIALVHDVNWKRISTTLEADSALTTVVDGPTLTLYRVDHWSGIVTDDAGIRIGADEVIPPWWTVDPSGPAVMHLPFQTGWLRGLEAAGTGPDGQIALPAGDGPVWFWPSIPVLATEILWIAMLLVATRRARRGRHGEKSADLMEHRPR
jgi:hypothetical protein